MLGSGQEQTLEQNQGCLAQAQMQGPALGQDQGLGQERDLHIATHSVSIGFTTRTLIRHQHYPPFQTDCWVDPAESPLCFSDVR